MLRKTILISAVVALITITGSARGMNGQNGSDISNNQDREKNSINRGHKRGGGDKSSMNSGQRGSQNIGTSLDNIPLSELTDTQKEGLVFMIEEEKVARDVYTHLYNTHGVRIFSNIARAEQKHMDALQILIDRYELEAPLTLGEVGIFENDELQELHDELIVKGDLSVTEALRVGITIEEVDIADLEDILNATVPQDFSMIYENLLRGSYNRINAFKRKLTQQSVN